MIDQAKLSPGLALGWALLLTLALFSANVAIGTFFGASNVAIIVAGPAEVALMWPASRLLARMYGQGSHLRDLALPSVSAVELLIAASLGVLLHLPIGYLSALVERLFPTPPKELQAELLILTPGSTALAVGMFVSIALLVPFVEELYFRGALFTALSRSNPAFVTIGTSSIAFALAHPKPRDWAALFVVALVLGEVRRRSGSIWACAALHAAFNATTLLYVFISKPLTVTPQEGSWLPAAFGCALTVSGVILFGRVATRRLGEVS